MSTLSKRSFSPVILFHDHHFVKEESGDLEHVHVPCGDPYYGQFIESHKRRIHRMLENNGRYWADIITWSRDHPGHMEKLSPVPSLVSSPTPPLHPHTTKSSKRRRGNLPKAVTAILREWLARHKKHPYPTEEEKASLARETNLTLNQISNWFINARRRILQPMLDREEEEKHELDILPYSAVHPFQSNHALPEDVFDRRLRKRSADAFSKYSPVKRLGSRRRQ
ncbi:Homeodomain-like protein [Phycomyces blakesleeanus]|uniref:Homeodomain-like protein n=2 Tax=Phycomyces blakesleeanus TaxID=4837 RepID=A0ABR3B5Y1_PHYBL